MTWQPAFTRFSYQHADGVSRSPLRILFTGASLLLAVVATAVLASAAAAVLLAVPLIAWLATPRQLLLGPRYLLCGNTIVYFGNVKRMTLSPTLGKLRLECTSGTAFVLERRRFPRSTRMAENLLKCKTTRFDTLSARIIEQVRAASANAVLMTA
ncbi:hypothetical protein HZ993_18295 [Rhodoferax sp. AJA081-3]|uniref:hypothetical protein n=1 Tax=Rhodoferax sp. AJA081-3 TaxID=2752316 RepID=UPI001AE04139|nr:hypothetical protein [Rhodoferax sp. AJA081-3]QTN27225.1 hypothetical protein HZ993_18295 [Rhodoferax sp. AJA081-3]